MDTEKKNSKIDMTILLGLVGLVVLVTLIFSIYAIFSSKTTDGEKTITIEILDKDQNSTVYVLETEAKFLLQAMEEAAEQGLAFSGNKQENSMMIDTINGVRANYEQDGAYWSLNVNGEYGQRSVNTQVITDGDKYQFVYTIAK